MPSSTTMPATETAVRPATRPMQKRSWLEVVSHTDPAYGGLSAAVPSLTASLAEEGSFDLTLAAFCRGGEHYQPPQVDSDQVSFWPTSRAAWMLDRDLKARYARLVGSVDALHIHGLWEESTAISCRLARRLRKPYLVSAHGMLEPWALATKRVKKQLYAALVERTNVAGAACLHALTLAEAEQYHKFGARCPIAVVPNAVHLPKDIHAELFFDHFPDLRGKRLLLFLSRLHPKKGLDLLLESWAQVGVRHPEAHLVVAGPDADGMQAKLAEFAEQHGIAAQVTFTGMLTGAMKWSALDAAEGYVLPSYSEGLSMALLEAMGMGLPVIATHACNMPEITQAGAGWEIEANVSELTEALSALLMRSAEENWAMGCKGARLIAARYSSEQVIRQMAEVYEYVLGGPAPVSVQSFTGEPR